MKVCVKLVDAQVQEWFPDKLCVDVVHGRGQLAAWELLLDVLKSTVQGLLVRGIGRDANGMATTLVDLVNNVGVALGLPSQQYDRVCFGKAGGDSTTYAS